MLKKGYCYYFLMTLKLQIVCFLTAAILFIEIASAQTLIAGKVYNSDYSNIIGGASVSVQCNGNILTTQSLADGTYAVRFENSQCTLGNGASITASKGSLTGTESGVVGECVSGNCNDEYSTVINTALKRPALEVLAEFRRRFRLLWKGKSIHMRQWKMRFGRNCHYLR